MEPKSQIVQASVIRVRFDPLGSYQRGSQYLRAAESFEDEGSFFPVGYFLYCRSIELFLKAFLLGKGMQVNVLASKKYGHCLEAILSKTKELELKQLVAVTQELEGEIIKADQYYSDKGFEYFQLKRWRVGYPALPDICMLAEFASLLEAELKSFCLNAS